MQNETKRRKLSSAAQSLVQANSSGSNPATRSQSDSTQASRSSLYALVTTTDLPLSPERRALRTEPVDGPKPDPETCFGGLYDIAARCNGVCEYQSLRLKWEGSRILKAIDPTSDHFEISQRDYSILQTISTKASAQFEITAHRSCSTRMRSRHTIESDDSHQFNLSINIYGSQRSAEEVGTFLGKCNMYIQIPDKCQIDVPYINPHCLPFTNDVPIMTSKFNFLEQSEGQNVESGEASIFSTLGNDEAFEEEPQPPSMRAVLHSHQRQALTFLLSREKGWDLNGLRQDIWRSYTDRFGRIRYQNTLSGLSHGLPPRAFRGGILADDMGLGKTVSVLALISLTLSLERCGCQAPPIPLLQAPFTKGTLIVMPLSLLIVWESQIKEHMSPDIRTFVYYGSGRTRNFAELSKYDIVITTYNVVCSEWKTGGRSSKQQKRKGLLFYTWHRIVLDEAHMIREKSTLNARAVCALDAIHRWCITGTPLQNRITDLSSLLLFLRAYPYNDGKTFESDIIEPWRKGVGEKPVQRLQALMKILALRRSKSTIDLPPRTDTVTEVKFDEMELKLYENARVGTMRAIDEAISNGPEAGSTYFSAFQRITDLRLICNHGLRHLMLSGGKSSSKPKTRLLYPPGLEEELDCLLDSSDQACRSCGTDISEELEGWRDIQLVPEEDALGLCISCQNKTMGISSIAATSPFSLDSEIGKAMMVSHELPSKIKAVVKHLQAVPQNEKCVIFSYWTSTLNILEQGLTAAGILFCRYDGRLRHSQRTGVLKKFQQDASVKAILVSITCGGQGLNLTVANHAILIEPQWNPMLEDQAISRIHRMRQQKAVHIVRFVMENSFEKKILNKQERKRALADLILRKDKLKTGDDGKKQLQHLKELVC
ncbi:hypothetical protein F5Y19DRAFT_483658 [Xylariaceae sp. FL1651]|nr:hypothetical protein F5Y19DRAFT_483658 [Xylariaceae sp. FL1651]